MPDLRTAALTMSRAWRDLTWRRLILAAVVAPVLPLYIGFAAFFLAYSDKNIVRVFRIAFEDTLFPIWGLGIAFTLLYLNLVPRLRGRIGFVECLAAGAAAAFLVAEAFFLAVDFDLMGPLPVMIFFPGFILAGGEHLPLAGALLGLVLAPAGALAGWIFWRIGVASAPPRSEVEVF